MLSFIYPIHQSNIIFVFGVKTFVVLFGVIIAPKCEETTQRIEIERMNDLFLALSKLIN